MEENTQKSQKAEESNRVKEMKRVLLNAIKMQALYSNGKITIVETSNLVN